MRRLPWPWEGQPDPLASAGRMDLSRIVALPDGAPTGPSPITGGETPGARDTIDRLMGAMVRSGHTVESAARRARAAAIRWDRKHR